MKDKLKKWIKNKKKLLMVIIVIILAAVVAGIILLASHPREGGLPDDEEMISEWEEEASTQSNRFAGVVEAADSWKVTREEGGTVKEFLVEEGQKVTEGTPLFTYDITSFETELAEKEIELVRLQNEYDSTEVTIETLKKEKKAAPSGEQGNYTIQIQEEELSLKQGKIDIDSKKKEIAKMKEVIGNATVKSKVNGVVRTISKGTGRSDMEDLESEGSEEVLMTISQTEALHVKGTLNELNVKDLSEGMRVIVHSRRDDSTWNGVVEKIELNNAEETKSSDEDDYYYEEGMESGSTNYPFIIKLESSEGLLIGQHVYIEAAGEEE